MIRAPSSLCQLAVIAVTVAVSVFSASPTVLSGAALEGKRGGVNCTTRGRINGPVCAAKPMQVCNSEPLVCNFMGSPKIHLCNPGGSSSGDCLNNPQNCVGTADDAIFTGDPPCTEVL